MSSETAIISMLLGLVAKPCLSPSLRISICSVDNSFPDKFTVTLFGLVSSFSDAAFMSRSLCSLLECRVVIFFLSLDNKRFTEKTISLAYIHVILSNIAFLSSSLVLRRREMFAFL